MLIKDIEELRSDVDVVLVYSPSEELNLFIQDRLREVRACTKDCVRELKSGTSFKEAEMDGSTQPLGSAGWLYKCELDKGGTVAKRVKKNLLSNTSALYFLTTDNYGCYKVAKEILKDNAVLVDLYIGYVKKEDITYLYEKMVRKKNRVSSALYSYFCETYSSDIVAILTFFEHLEAGNEVTDKKQIIEICGFGGNTIPKFTLELLMSRLNSDKSREGKDLEDEKVLKNIDSGRKRIVKNKLQKAYDIREVYTWRYIHSAVLSTVIALCDLKILYINGHLYKKHLDRDHTEGYDDKSLTRGMKFWYKIHELPLSYLVELRSELESRVWDSNLDFDLFLYKYYR